MSFPSFSGRCAILMAAAAAAPDDIPTCMEAYNKAKTVTRWKILP